MTALGRQPDAVHEASLPGQPERGRPPGCLCLAGEQGEHEHGGERRALHGQHQPPTVGKTPPGSPNCRVIAE